MPPPRLRLAGRHWPAVGAGRCWPAPSRVWARHRLFPGLSWNRDEPVYLWHVDVLRAGQLTSPTAATPTCSSRGCARRATARCSRSTRWAGPSCCSRPLLPAARPRRRRPGPALAVVGTWAFVHELRARRASPPARPLSCSRRRSSPCRAASTSTTSSRSASACSSRGAAPGVRHRPSVAAGGAGRPARLDLPHPPLRRRPVGARLAASRGRRTAPWRRARRVGGVRRPARCPWWSPPSPQPAPHRALPSSRSPWPTRWTSSGSALGGSCPASPRSTTPRRSGSARGQERSSCRCSSLGSYLGALVAAVGLWIRRRERATLARRARRRPCSRSPTSRSWAPTSRRYFTRLSGRSTTSRSTPAVAVLVATVVVRLRRHRPAAVGLVVALCWRRSRPVSRLTVNHDLSAPRRPGGLRRGDRGRALVFVADSSRYLLFAQPVQRQRRRPRRPHPLRRGRRTPRCSTSSPSSPTARRTSSGPRSGSRTWPHGGPAPLRRHGAPGGGRRGRRFTSPSSR